MNASKVGEIAAVITMLCFIAIVLAGTAWLIRWMLFPG